MNDQPDPPRLPFGEACQQMRRDLIVTMQAYQVFSVHAIELIERPNCTLRIIREVVNGLASSLDAILMPQQALHDYSNELLADVGLDLPLGVIPKQTGEPNHGS